MKKNDGYAILRKIRKWQFLAKIVPNFSISCLIRWLFDIFCQKFWKNVFQFNFFFNWKKIILGKKSTFRPYDTPYESPVPTLQIKWWFFVFFLFFFFRNRILELIHLKKGQNTDLNSKNLGGPLKSQKMAKNEFTHGNNEFLRSRVLRYTFKHKVRRN